MAPPAKGRGEWFLCVRAIICELMGSVVSRTRAVRDRGLRRRPLSPLFRSTDCGVER